MEKSLVDNIRIINQEMQKNIFAYQKDRWGSRYVQYRNNWSDARQLKLKTAFPMHIDLDTTDACNLHCPFCWAEGEHYQRLNIKMSSHLINGIFDEINSSNNKDQLGAMNVGTIGEPLLFPGIAFDILKKCIDAQVMDKFVHTNGHLLTLDIFKSLVDLYLTYLLVSLDAIHEDTYKKVRGDNFSKVKHNILNIVEYKKKNNLFFPIIRVSFVESELNTLEKDDFINYFKEKVDIVEIQPCVDYSYSLSNNNKVNFHCHHPFQRITIGLQGEMALCCSGYSMLPDFYIAKFPETSIQDTWLHEKSQKLREALKTNKLEEYSYCYKCLASRS